MTADALLLAPLACGVVLAVSGAAKLANATGTREAFVAMGVPRALRSARLVRALPFVELALGGALVVTWGWLLAAVAAAVIALFATYWVLVARVLRSGDQVDCGCFGALGDDRITGRTLLRNSVLVVLAVLAFAFGLGGSGVVPALRDLEGADWWWPVMAALVAAAGVLVVAPARPPDDGGFPEDQIDYFRQPIPIGALYGEDGDRVTLRELAAQRPQLLVFLEPGCGSCHVVAEWLPGFAARLDPVDVVTVFSHPLDLLPDDMRPEGITRLHDRDQVVTTLFVNGRPSAVLLGADGQLAGGPVVGGRPIESFVDEIEAELSSEPVPATVFVPPDPGHHHDHDHAHDHPHGHVEARDHER